MRPGPAAGATRPRPRPRPDTGRDRPGALGRQAPPGGQPRSHARGRRLRRPFRPGIGHGPHRAPARIGRVSRLSGYHWERPGTGLSLLGSGGARWPDGARWPGRGRWSQICRVRFRGGAGIFVRGIGRPGAARRLDRGDAGTSGTGADRVRFRLGLGKWLRLGFGQRKRHSASRRPVGQRVRVGGAVARVGRRQCRNFVIGWLGVLGKLVFDSRLRQHRPARRVPRALARARALTGTPGRRGGTRRGPDAGRQARWCSRRQPRVRGPADPVVAARPARPSSGPRPGPWRHRGPCRPLTPSPRRSCPRYPDR